MHKRIFIIHMQSQKENLYWEKLAHYFSKCNSAHHYFSKCNSAHHYFSKCNSAPHYFSKYNLAPLFNFFWVQASSYFLFLNVSQRLSFVLLGMKQCPIVVPNNFIFHYYFLDYLIMFQMLFSNYVQNF